VTVSQLSEVDRAEILERYRKGQSVHQLAVRFRTSHMSILRALPDDEPRRPVGYQPKPVSTEWIVELRKAGHSYAEIGKMTGLSTTGARKRYLTACHPGGAAG